MFSESMAFDVGHTRWRYSIVSERPRWDTNGLRYTFQVTAHAETNWDRDVWHSERYFETLELAVAEIRSQTAPFARADYAHFLPGQRAEAVRVMTEFFALPTLASKTEAAGHGK